jgi:hypothetical protein
MSKTVFIIGAGASYEYNLPFGSGLVTDIASVLQYTIQRGKLAQYDETLIEAYFQLAREETNGGEDIEPYLKAANRIARNMPQVISIDNFIDMH